MDNEKKKVVIYARTKTKNIGGLSIDEQLAKCYKYCEDNNFIVVGEYIDITNNIQIEDRQNFMKMIDDSNNRNFEGVIVYGLDRISRNRYESFIYKNKLENNNVKLYIANINTANDISEIIIENVVKGFVEYLSENKRLLEEILKQQEANLNNGQ